MTLNISITPTRLLKRPNKHVGRISTLVLSLRYTKILILFLTKLRSMKYCVLMVSAGASLRGKWSCFVVPGEVARHVNILLTNRG